MSIFRWVYQRVLNDLFMSYDLAPPSPPPPVSTLQRKSHLCIPFLRIARPPPQFPHSCVCVGERFIWSQDRSTYFLQQNRQTGTGRLRKRDNLRTGGWGGAKSYDGESLVLSNHSILFDYWLSSFYSVTRISSSSPGTSEVIDDDLCSSAGQQQGVGPP